MKLENVENEISLKNVATVDLVNELQKREGVERTMLAPNVEAQVSVSGPAIVLSIID